MGGGEMNLQWWRFISAQGSLLMVLGRPEGQELNPGRPWQGKCSPQCIISPSPQITISVSLPSSQLWNHQHNLILEDYIIPIRESVPLVVTRIDLFKQWVAIPYWIIGLNDRERKHREKKISNRKRFLNTQPPKTEFSTRCKIKLSCFWQCLSHLWHFSGKKGPQRTEQ